MMCDCETIVGFAEIGTRKHPHTVQSLYKSYHILLLPRASADPLCRVAVETGRIVYC
jgi:hypothetical protein